MGFFEREGDETEKGLIFGSWGSLWPKLSLLLGRDHTAGVTEGLAWSAATCRQPLLSHLLGAALGPGQLHQAWQRPMSLCE